MNNNWTLAAYALFAFEAPLVALELVRPGLVTQFVPLHFMWLPLVFVLPAAYAREE